MAVLKIHEYGDPVLRLKARDVDELTDEDRRLIEDMAETMFDEPGVGLAAPQVGVSRRIIVVDERPGSDQKKAIALINPRIVEASNDSVVIEEGCLSIPDFRGDVRRPRMVVVRATNLDGEEMEFSGSEMHSRIFQHEIDHLDGILFVDRLSPLKRDIAKRKLRKRLRNGEFSSSLAE
ncbi:peptide deformylase [bacterium]|nr:peptide deformylase [candidate division CSSED10-310 bacterium]